MKKVIHKVVLCLGIILVILGIAFFAYTMIYYHAKEYSGANNTKFSKIKITKYDDFTLYGNKTANTGFIFYPGGKVEAQAYQPLLMTIAAEEGISCVLVDMPLRLAVFDINAADKVKEELPQIKNWYIGGHSLGGAMAASYVAKHTSEYKGLILMGAYPVSKLPDSFKVITFYGSNDQVMNKENYEKNKSYAKQLTEIVIKGGNHAWFGYYGEQNKDGKATISHEEQWNVVSTELGKFIN